MKPPFIRQVTIRNYKSIAACRLNLGPLTFMVGPNGAGKSNFLDALRFVADALRSSLDHALRDRGTIKEVRRRSGGHPNHFALRVEFELPSGRIGHYAFRIDAKRNANYEVRDEECFVYELHKQGGCSYFRTHSGEVVKSTSEIMPLPSSDRLYLVSASGIPEFREVYESLSRIESYNPSFQAISHPQRQDGRQILDYDAGNSAAIFQNIDDETRVNIVYNMKRIVPNLENLRTISLGEWKTTEFKFASKLKKHSWRTIASSESDGTLRAFGVLLAVFQAASTREGSNPPLLIGLEEPEIALHPAAAGILLSALREGAKHCQTIVTSHSPDLLDNPDIPVDALLAVDNHEGLTRIGPIDEAGKQMLRDHLWTPGELLRQKQLAPAPEAIEDIGDERQLKLFDIGGR